ncbi:MAG: DedA family protein/thiosulfate sulfurtransferase GlpE [Acidobacteriota bacterium]|nr:DedA family protein/thiosulfate sulfurtransferase GlpE [Acidobacteriota bacterium]
MEATLQFLLRHGGVVLLAAAFADQIGLPFSAIPFLIGMGALAGRGQFPLAIGIPEAVAATLAADIVWFELGRNKGHAILKLLCKISLEPDSCVRRSEERYARLGAKSLAFVKFVPGLSTATTSMAGLFRMRLSIFLAWDAMGAVLWAGAYTALGLVFSKQIARAAGMALGLGVGLTMLLILALAGFVAYKYAQRRSFIRSLNVSRLTPEQLMDKLRRGEQLVIVDLRSRAEFEANPDKLPGAVRLAPEDLQERAAEIPRDRDVILYCTCPNEATSARVALLLRSRGVTRVRPLAGGYDAWRSRRFPLETSTVAPADAPSAGAAASQAGGAIP